jgi:hypothetical protein
MAKTEALCEAGRLIIYQFFSVLCVSACPAKFFVEKSEANLTGVMRICLVIGREPCALNQSTN